MHRFHRQLLFGILAVSTALSVLVAGNARAASAKDYAYLFVQGRIGQSYENRPLEGIVVRLVQQDRTFETSTDHRGVFLFEKLPRGSYELDLLTVDGKTIRGTWQTDPGDRERVRVRIKLGKRAGNRIRIEAVGELPGVASPGDDPGARGFVAVEPAGRLAGRRVVRGRESESLLRQPIESGRSGALPAVYPQTVGAGCVERQHDEVRTRCRAG